MRRRYVILVGDGMGDYPLPELDGQTPLEAARTPNLDRLASIGRMGLVCTIPEGMEPGSDVANMSLLGYDPLRYHTGRGPLEAASIGITLDPEDVAFRCNLVTVRQDSGGSTIMEDYSAGHISTEEAHRLIESLQKAIYSTALSLYPGVSYRHLLVWKGGRSDLRTTPPHDISGQEVGLYRQCYLQTPELLDFMERAAEILSKHPVNRNRLREGRRPANAVWLWGQGKAPAMPTLKDRFGLSGAMITAVDLLKGLGVYAGLEPVRVPGATGYLDTNYEGKVQAALKALEDRDMVYVHIEAPDETSHEGNLEKKLEAIQAFDERVIGPITTGLGSFDQVRVLIVTDHLTPIKVRTHVSDPVPFLFLENLKDIEKGGAPNSGGRFCERSARNAGWYLPNGMELFSCFVKPDTGGSL